ncbi:3-hydroxyacyl-[acyl-carrier-protein] dehydratase [Oxalobacteraceae bacterium GrIS 1.11]
MSAAPDPRLALALIPQRPPFLLLDAIVDGEPGRHAASRYLVRPDHPVLAGHFPGRPIFPGVLVIENMAQTACWVCAAQERDEATLYVLVRVTLCTFHQMVKPGDELQSRARLMRQVNQFSQFECEATVDGVRVASAELLVARQAN